MPLHSSHLTLSEANAIITRALEAGRESRCQPLTVVVLDAGGHVIASQRQDGAGILRFEIAFGKAWGALGMGLPSRKIEEISLQRPVFVSSLAAAAGGRLVPVSGGVLVLDPNEVILGAVGISGDTSDADEKCAIEGILATGMHSLPGANTGAVQ